jgi:uroporphyrinogen decarboxylase
MTPRQAVLNAIRHEQVSPVPYTLGFDGDLPAQLDKHYGGPQWRDRIVPYIHGSAACHTMKRWPIDESDPGLGRDIWGAVWRSDCAAMHLEKPALGEPSLKNYRWPQIEEFYYTDADLEATIKDLAAHQDRLPVGYVFWGLFEQSWAMRGFQNILTDIIAEEDFFVEMLDRITEIYLALTERTCRLLPVDAIMFGDDWSDQRGVIIGAQRWRKFYKPRWAKIYDCCHRHGKSVITHCCGSVVDLIDDAIEIGLDVLESVQPEAVGMNPYELKRRWGHKLTFWGGLGAQSILPFGTPAGIQAEVRRLRAEMGRGGGYILAPAKSLQPGTPLKNAVAALEAFTEERTG